MSDDERVMSEEEEAPAAKMAPPESSGPSEAQLAMQRRRAAQASYGEGLDEAAREMLEANKEERAKMEDEIEELRKRSEERKKEREEEERRMAERRAEEEARRKAEEEERRAKKEAEEMKRREARAQRMAEFEKWKNPPQRNFVITKREDGSSGLANDDDESTDGMPKKSKEQLEAEKQAILSQRIPPCNTDGMDSSKLAEKAKELHSLIYRLEGEKYDLEKRFKAQQYDMQELAERARQMNKVGKDGTVKRVNMTMDEVDEMQLRFAGAPSKIEMYSKYERQKDKRTYGDRKVLFTGDRKSVV